ncbi:MAG: MlaD family protein [Capnocytophaga sp.]|nr:MlaD family protein [Capnocytophaga sp.]
MKISKEIKTAIIVIAGIASFFVGFNFLKSKSIFKSSNTYYAVFDHSGGLKPGTAVTVNGVQIGTVESVTLNEQTAKIDVTLSCSRDFTFSKNSKAELYSSLLGGTGLQVVPAFDDAPKAKSGDVLPSSVQLGLLESLSSQIAPTQVKLNSLLSKSDTTLASVNELLNDKTIADLQKAIADLSVTMQYLSKSSAALDQLLSANQQSLNGTLANANKITDNLAKLSDTLAQADIDKMLAEAKNMLGNMNQLMAGIEQGNGSLGKLMKDEQLYKNLENASKELELLLEDFRLNPKRYVHFSVFGRKAKPYEATAEEAEKALGESENNP